ncbi:hypothetical protein BB561_005544 [Smittium simulii]|uniref:Uncharacterized protein n=1 Tax=Smittium simulii TaxID=133385 RepID=A0A2T9Y9W3_9FUNG|nr:hypothetical protein BB561_005544 [Smittium simulii]
MSIIKQSQSSSYKKNSYQPSNQQNDFLNNSDDILKYFVNISEEPSEQKNSNFGKVFSAENQDPKTEHRVISTLLNAFENLLSHQIVYQNNHMLAKLVYHDRTLFSKVSNIRNGSNILIQVDKLTGNFSSKYGSSFYKPHCEFNYFKLFQTAHDVYKSNASSDKPLYLLSKSYEQLLSQSKDITLSSQSKSTNTHNSINQTATHFLMPKNHKPPGLRFSSEEALFLCQKGSIKLDLPRLLSINDNKTDDSILPSFTNHLLKSDWSMLLIFLALDSINISKYQVFSTFHRLGYVTVNSEVHGLIAESTEKMDFYTKNSFDKILYFVKFSASNFLNKSLLTFKLVTKTLGRILLPVKDTICKSATIANNIITSISIYIANKYYAKFRKNAFNSTGHFYIFLQKFSPIMNIQPFNSVSSIFDHNPLGLSLYNLYKPSKAFSKKDLASRMADWRLACYPTISSTNLNFNFKNFYCELKEIACNYGIISKFGKSDKLSKKIIIGLSEPGIVSLLQLEVFDSGNNFC